MASTHKQVIDLIKSLTGQANVLSIPRSFIDYTGSLDAGLFLSQVLYWSDKGDEQGWFYKTYTEWEKELCLGEYEVRKAIKILRDERGVIETKIKKANGSPTLHFRLKNQEFSDSFLEFLQERTLSNSRNKPLESELSITETTPKITTEINGASAKNVLDTFFGAKELPIDNIKKPLKKQKVPISLAVAMHQQVTEYYQITTYWREQITLAVGDTPDSLEKWKETLIAWTGRSFFGGNVQGQLAWFKDGIPKYTGKEDTLNMTTRNGRNTLVIG